MTATEACLRDRARRIFGAVFGSKTKKAKRPPVNARDMTFIFNRVCKEDTVAVFDHQWVVDGITSYRTEEYCQTYFWKHYVDLERRSQMVNERETPLQCMVQVCGAYNDLVLPKTHIQEDQY